MGKPLDVDALLAEAPLVVAPPIIASQPKMARIEASRRPREASARQILAKVCDLIRSTPKGARNGTITGDAAGMGSLVSYGYLDYGETRAALLAAMQTGGFDVSKHVDTLDRQLAWGMQHPLPDTLGDEAISGREEWKSRLRLNANKVPAATLANLVHIFTNDPKWATQLNYNEMELSYALRGKPVDDQTISQVRFEIDTDYGFQAPEGETIRALQLVATASSYHPVRRYLSPLRWDATPRIAQLLDRVLPCDRSDGEETVDLYRMLLVKWFIGAAERALRPGCKMDVALLLRGDQGTYKSTFFKSLCPDEKWFSDSKMDIESKDAFQALAGSWIIEWAELETVTRKHDVSAVKAFLTSSSDRFRPPFGKSTIIAPRSSVIVGSTNKSSFLNDATGDRRFWVLPITGRIDVAAVKADRDQLWAEAKARLESGEKSWLSQDEEDRRVRLVGGKHDEEDVWTAPVLAWTNGRSEFTVAQVLQLACGMQIEHMDRRAEMRVGEILTKARFEKRQRRVEGVRSTWWSKARS